MAALDQCETEVSGLVIHLASFTVTILMCILQSSSEIQGWLPCTYAKWILKFASLFLHFILPGPLLFFSGITSLAPVSTQKKTGMQRVKTIKMIADFSSGEFPPSDHGGEKEVAWYFYFIFFPLLTSFFFLIWVYLTHIVTLVAGVQHSDSTTLYITYCSPWWCSHHLSP